MEDIVSIYRNSDSVVYVLYDDNQSDTDWLLLYRLNFCTAHHVTYDTVEASISFP